MPKLVLTKEKEPSVTKPVFIGVDVHKQLLSLKEESGIPLVRIVDKILKFGIANLEIKEDEE